MKVFAQALVGWAIFMVINYIYFKVKGSMWVFDSFIEVGFMSFVLMYAIGLYLSQEQKKLLKNQKLRALLHKYL